MILKQKEMIRGCRSTRKEKDIIKSKVGESKDTQNLDIWSDKKEQSIGRHLEQKHGGKVESFRASSSNEHLIFDFVLSLCLALFGSIPPYTMFPGLWIIGHLNSWLLTLPFVYGLTYFHLLPNAQFSGADPQLQCMLKAWMTYVSKASSTANLSHLWIPYPNTSQLWLCSWKFCTALKNRTQKPARPAAPIVVKPIMSNG